MPPKGRNQRRGWGKLRQRASGNWEASYIGPDARRHSAPHTFAAKIDGEAWLVAQKRRIDAGTWTPTAAEPDPVLTLGEYAETWLERRELRETTRRQYRHSLDAHILPEFGRQAIAEVTPAHVARWEAKLRHITGPTQAAHSYALLRTVYRAAVREDLVTSSPCRVPGAGQAKRASDPVILEPSELAALADAITPELRALVLLAGWCALRLGELLELRRKDVDLDAGTVSVRRQVQHLPGRPPLIGVPKTHAGRRTVHMPLRVVDAMREHLATYSATGRDGLVFPSAKGEHWPPSTVRDKFRTAARAIGRPDLKVHTLRHTAATLAARTGATTAELMDRIGHASPQAALRYQHAARSRDAAIAAALDQFQ